MYFTYQVNIKHKTNAEENQKQQEYNNDTKD